MRIYEDPRLYPIDQRRDHAMRSVLSLRTFGGLLCSVVLAASFEASAVAADRGILVGSIKDKRTGKPLPGVNIVIEGTKLGAIADERGFYVVDDVPVGTHSVTGSIVGYNSITVPDVEIAANQRTVLDFELSPVALELEEIVVTATRTERRMREVPATLSFISREEIQGTKVWNIAETLRDVPGVCAREMDGTGQSWVTFRGVDLGTGVPGVLVLVDGVLQNDENGRVDFSRIDLEDVERIEVVKGPSSALYGGNAMGGVINILTESACAGDETTLAASLGSYGAEKYRLSTRGGNGKLCYSVLFDRHRSDGWRDHNAYDASNVHGKLVLLPDDRSSLRLDLSYHTTERDIPGPLSKAGYEAVPTRTYYPFDRSDVESTRMMLNYERDLGENSKITLGLHSRSERIDETIEYYRWSPGTGLRNIDVLGGEAKYQVHRKVMGRENALLVGGDVRRYTRDARHFTIVSTTRERQDLDANDTVISSIVAGYVQDELHPLDRCILTLGIRYDGLKCEVSDYFPDDGDQSGSDYLSNWSPKFGLVYLPTSDVSLFLHLGMAFRPPSPGELEHFFGTGGKLDPERMTNYELGIKAGQSDRWTGTFSLYRMDMRDKIVFDRQADPVYQNVGKIRYNGAEARVRLRLGRDLSLRASYTYSDAKYIDYKEYGGKFVPETPRHRASGTLSYRHPFGIRISVRPRWSDEYFLDDGNTETYEGHTVTDGRVAYERGRHAFSVNMDNLFDVKYASRASATRWDRILDYDFYPAPGRTYMLGVKISLR